MVSLAETTQAAEALPNGQLHIVEQTPHPFEKVNIPAFTGILASFFAAE
jgi:hypothetical protein